MLNTTATYVAARTEGWSNEVRATPNVRRPDRADDIPASSWRVPSCEQRAAYTLQPAQVVEVCIPGLSGRGLVHQTRGLGVGVEKFVHEYSQPRL